MGVLFILLASLCWALDGPIRYPLLTQGIDSSFIVFLEHTYLLFIIFLIVIFEKFWRKKVASHGSDDKGMAQATNGTGKDEFRFSLLDGVAFFVIGALGSALATLAFTRAFLFLNPSQVILLQKLQPLVAFGLAHFWLKERLPKQFIPWAILCALGALLVAHQEIVQGFHIFTQSLGENSEGLDQRGMVGLMLTFIAVVGWGSSTVFGKYLGTRGFAPKEIMFGRFATGFLALLPLPLSGNLPMAPWGLVYGKILLMVSISGLLGMFLYYKGLKSLPAKLTGILEMSYPLMAVIINWALIGTRLDILQLLGGLLLMGASSMLQRKV